jgi:hypothetical protein
VPSNYVLRIQAGPDIASKTIDAETIDTEAASEETTASVKDASQLQVMDAEDETATSGSWEEV